MTRTMPIAQYAYEATLVRVVDGDTIVVSLKVFPGAILQGTLRLLEVDTPEKYGETKDAGLAAMVYTTNFLGTSLLMIQVVKRDSFGRWLSYVFRQSDGACLNDALIEEGYGTYIPALQHLKQAGTFTGGAI